MEKITSIMITLKERYLGSMIGLAVGDALGASVEFQARDSFVPIRNYREGGKFNVIIGEYTDDTAMALCLAKSLIEKNGTDQKDQLQKYLLWYESGYLSANSRSIGCGKTILRALQRYLGGNCSECGNIRLKKGACNGSLMRVAPVALFYAKNRSLAMEMAAKSSYTTHGLKICADACMVFTAIIIGAIEGKSKKDLLSSGYAKEIFGALKSCVFDQEIVDVVLGSYKNKIRDEISSSGYVVNTLEAALWAFYNSESFDEGLILSVNLGFDADTVAAVYGQIAGAYYGIDMIGNEFKNNLLNVELIKSVSLDLYELLLTKQ